MKYPEKEVVSMKKKILITSFDLAIGGYVPTDLFYFGFIPLWW